MRRSTSAEDSSGADGSGRAVAAWPAVEEFLRARGAGGMDHPGGTLLEHLLRVGDRLGAWGADPAVQLAGLCHAAYGTDGFGQRLVQPGDRAVLSALIGERAEALVHLYATCDRRTVYPRLGCAPPVVFRDRLTGREHTPSEPDIRAFLDLADRHGPVLYRLFSRARGLLSAAAWEACVRQLGRYAPEAAPGIRMTGLDHLVLTVADLERTVDFYERVLGMSAVTFGEGRRALTFGASKINLHQVGRELRPHAMRPTAGSADLCLVTDTPQEHILAHLSACGVPVEQGPVPRTGARGPITSTYLRDPDGNLIEISTYNAPSPSGT